MMIIRRRVTAVAVAAAVAIAAAVVVPLLARQLSHSAPIQRSGYHITVHPPGPGSPKGLIASGLIDGHRWLAAARFKPSTHQLCFDIFRMGSGGCGDARHPPRVASSGAPLGIRMASGGGGTTPRVDIATVRGDVTYLRVSLSNGQVLTLKPVAVFGAKYAAYVALAVPYVQAVARVTAYSARGELGYSVPFTAAGDYHFVRWLRPGQAALPRPRRYLIGSGRASSFRWSEYASVGPWGTCFWGRGFGGTFCFPAGPGQLPGANAAKVVAAAFSNSHPGIVVIAAAPSVSYLEVLPVGGHWIRPKPVRVGDGRVFCIFLGNGQLLQWNAYSASGSILASGGPMP